ARTDAADVDRDRRCAGAETAAGILIVWQDPGGRVSLPRPTVRRPDRAGTMTSPGGRPRRPPRRTPAERDRAAGRTHSRGRPGGCRRPAQQSPARGEEVDGYAAQPCRTDDAGEH